MNIKDVVEVLGGRRVLKREIATELELADAVQEGLPSASLDAVHAEMAPDQPIAFVARLVGSERTIARKRTNKDRLSSWESDRLARLARLTVRATEALGDRQKARIWWLRRNRSLEGRTPASLLLSDVGATVVEGALGRLEHGVFS